jgi:DNA repair protein RadA/Sms
MSKARSIWRCQACGYQAFGWMGRCPQCGEWDTFTEEKKNETERVVEIPTPLSLKKIPSLEKPRFSSGISEFDRVLGGGIVPGAVILVGGEPGIGKSTLLLQVAHHLSQNKRKILYISGEESPEQVAIRAKRLGIGESNLSILCETEVEKILAVCEEMSSDVLIVDSIQTLFSSEIPSPPGSVAQVRNSSSRLINLAKKKSMSLFIVGHVTKEGVIAGPKILEHMVDTVLYFEGESEYFHRVLRAVKNRFGPTDEVGVFEMAERGLIEVKEPSHYFLSSEGERAGFCITAVMEGTRTFLVEIQSLVSRSYLPSPRRLAVGLDYNRFLMISAVLEKLFSIPLYECDIYVSTAGGIKVTEPAADLGIALSLLSSYYEKPLSKGVVFGEIDLTGRLRRARNAEQRVKEAEKLGFKWVISPPCGKIKTSVNLRQFSSLGEVLEEVKG